ncbi:MAG: F0F1 ATP synthase subunit B [Hyphomicrobiaceae bacterium]
MTDQAQTEALILAQTESSGSSTTTTTTGEATTSGAATSTDTHGAATGEALTESVGVAPEAEHGKKAFPPLDPTHFSSQLIWFAIAFGALYLIMSRVALPKIGAVIDERKARIRRDLDEAERMKGETEKALKAYEQAVAEARGNASQIAQATRDKLKTEVDGERQRVEKEIADRLAKAEAQIKSATASAMAKVGDIASDTAESIVGELVGLKVGRDEVAGAVKSVLKH